MVSEVSLHVCSFPKQKHHGGGHDHLLAARKHREKERATDEDSLDDPVTFGKPAPEHMRLLRDLLDLNHTSP